MLSVRRPPTIRQTSEVCHRRRGCRVSAAGARASNTLVVGLMRLGYRGL
jgi:hypothetical protein